MIFFFKSFSKLKSIAGLYRNMANKRRLDDLRSNLLINHLKKAKNDERDFTHMLIEEIEFKKSKNKALLTFKILYGSDPLLIRTQKLLFVSVDCQSIKFGDYYIPIEDLKKFIVDLKKDNSCNLKLDVLRVVAYDNNTKKWTDNISNYGTVTLQLTNEIRESIAEELKLHIIDKIARYMEI